MKSTFVMTGSRGWSLCAPVLVAGLFLGGCGSDSDNEAEPDPAQPEPLELKSIDPAEFSSPDAVAVLAGTLFFDLTAASSFDEDRFQARDIPDPNVEWCDEGGQHIPAPPAISFFKSPLLDGEDLAGTYDGFDQCVTDGELVDGLTVIGERDILVTGDQGSLPPQDDVLMAAFQGSSDTQNFRVEGKNGTELELLGLSHQKESASTLQRYSRWAVASRFSSPFGEELLSVQMQFGKRIAPGFEYDGFGEVVPLTDYFAREVTNVGNSGNTEVTVNGRWGIQWTAQCGGGLVDLETLAPLQQTSSNEPYIAGKLRLTATEKTADAELVGPDELVVTLDGVSRSYSKSDVNDLVEACVTQ